jgi:drug/metabolite transporter (DMT)-like permease
MREVPLFIAVGMRSLLAAIFILPFYFRSGPHHWTWAEVPKLAGLGLLGVVFNQLAFAEGMRRTSIAHAAFIIGLVPVLTVLIAAWRGHERLKKRRIAGMGLAILGVTLLQVFKGSAGAATLAGDAFVLLAAMFFAVFVVFGKETVQQHHGMVMTTFAYVVGFFLLAPFMWFQSRTYDISTLSQHAIWSIAYIVIFPSVIAFVLFHWALRRTGASRVSAFSYLQPVMGTAMATPILGEPFTLPMALAGAVIMSGVWLAERD